MAKRRHDSGERDEASESLPTADVLLGESSERTVPMPTDPSKPVRRRKIHKRRKVPRVRKGEAVEDPDPTPPADIAGD